MSEDAVRYDATRIEVLEGREAIRRRPEMYVGSTGERGLHQLAFEAVDRAVNEVLAGRAGTVDVTLTRDRRRACRRRRAGPARRGRRRHRRPCLEDQLTRMHAGAQPGGRHAVDVGLFGIGLCVANALSSRLTAEVRRRGVRWVQECTRGVAVTPTGSGTTIAFRPDADVFGASQCSFTVLVDRFRELAFLNRGLGMSLTDERGPSSARWLKLRYPAGVVSCCRLAADGRVVACVGECPGRGGRGFPGWERRFPCRMGDLVVCWSLSRSVGSSLMAFGGEGMGGLRELAASFVVPGPTGVAVRDRLKHLSAEDEKVLRLVGGLLGGLASRDLKARCSAGLEHDPCWAAPPCTPAWGTYGNTSVRGSHGTPSRPRLSAVASSGTEGGAVPVECRQGPAIRLSCPLAVRPARGQPMSERNCSIVRRRMVRKASQEPSA
ncbi:hypothetical protein [Streptomyces sp. NPDC052107]|uniref:hypothetical protein n=1 Tax=Streptomyces sp. NPDC052107 TaxID=3155632 RepID=UPI00343485AF